MVYNVSSPFAWRVVSFGMVLASVVSLLEGKIDDTGDYRSSASN